MNAQTKMQQMIEQFRQNCQILAVLKESSHDLAQVSIGIILNRMVYGYKKIHKLSLLNTKDANIKKLVGFMYTYNVYDDLRGILSYWM